MAYIIQHAGGKATNGTINLLDVHPVSIGGGGGGGGDVHVRIPCFMGSLEDMDELMRYMTTPEKEEEEEAIIVTN